MHRSLTAVAAALCLTLGAPPVVALAEGPTPTPPTSTAPSPAPSPSPSASPTAGPTPAASPSPTPSADPLIAEELERVAGARLDEMRRVIAATSLLERIEAQRRLAAAEREFLLGRLAELRAAHEHAVLEVAAARARADERRAVLERLLQQTYRVSRTSPLEVLLRRGSVVDVVVHMDSLAALSKQEREVLEELRALEAELARQRDEAARQEAEIAALAETVAAKDAALAELEKRAERLAAAASAGARAVSDAQIELLRDMAEAAVRETEAADRLIAEIAARSGVELPRSDRWTWPLAGRVTQEFGPSGLALEPPRTYKGVTYPRFHEGLDIAAPLGTPVRATARGRVAFVGHIAGGAMVVVIAHDARHVTLYAHLDDTAAPPPVRAGDVVEPGERIGAVGLTGVTTGPHLHFVVSYGDEPIDPRVVLPPEPERP